MPGNCVKYAGNIQAGSRKATREHKAVTHGVIRVVPGKPGALAGLWILCNKRVFEDLALAGPANVSKVTRHTGSI